MGAAACGPGPVELIGSGQDLEARLVLHHELLQELAIEAVEVVDGVQQAIAGPHAEEERDLAEPGLQIDDHRRFLAQTSQFDSAVHRQGRSAGTTLCTKEHEGRRRRPRALRRFPARRRPAHRAVERFLVGRPGEELVGTGPHRLEDEIGIGRRRDGKDAGAGRTRAQPLDARHRGRRIAARVDDDEVRRRRVARGALVDDADRNRARAQQATEVLLERVVFRDDETNQLCHGYF